MSQHTPGPAMTQALLEILARETARSQGLQEALVCAVVEQESAWNPWAMRYETGFFSRYILPQVERGEIKSSTEAYGRAVSWGLMQVMGETARAFGFREKYFSQMCEPGVGLEIGCKVLNGYLAQKGNDLRAGLLRWNGGGRSDYPDEVLARMAKYGGGT